MAVTHSTPPLTPPVFNFEYAVPKSFTDILSVSDYFRKERQ
jgi:hypothetical protein